MAAPRPTDEELLRSPPQEMLRWLHRAEAENLKVMMDHGAMMREVNRRMQVHLMEIRSLREVNERLQRDSEELRDLCCFLDDDRQKGRKLAREWQRFGRYTASVMRQEVAAYQGKLRGLDIRQQDLLRDNLQLKELCLYLDQERNRHTCPNCGGSLLDSRRDDGDGSSSSATNQESPLPPSVEDGRPIAIEEAIHRHRTVINEQVLRYIRNLERRIQVLEMEQGQSPVEDTNDNRQGERRYALPFQGLANGSSSSDLEPYLGVARPEAVVHAMKVLEVREQLDKTTDSEPEFEELAEGEKALVREMCNIVWRKLEDGPT
ncbi:coiled-coil domain-containing protein 85C-A-like isoform X2 [Ornithodoros turicata]|uniref:coiled-coil domain-containing protein 85C-A-like isoform X2 n=1 Tax=Ornithodoros turicata TaxID=34597 RepID=UPI0031393C18